MRHECRYSVIPSPSIFRDDTSDEDRRTSLRFASREPTARRAVVTHIPPFSGNPDLVSRALQINAEVERFRERWSPLPASGPCVSFTWEELERQLVDLAPSDL